MKRSTDDVALGDAENEGVGRSEIEVLSAMSRVHAAAAGERASAPGGAGDPGRGLLAGAEQATRTSLASARGILREQYVVGPTRLAGAKRAVLKGSRLLTYRLVDAANALADAADGLLRLHAETSQQIDEQRERLRRELMVEVRDEIKDEVERSANSLRALVVTVEQASQDSIDSLADDLLDANDGPAELRTSARARDSRLAVLEGRMAEIERERVRDRAELVRLRSLTSVQVSPSSHVETDGPRTAGPVVDDVTYAQFEKRFRGSRSEIRERQLNMLRFVELLVGSQKPLLDLGCGRGEWLDVVGHAGIPAYGVDSNAAMVGEAVSAGMDARTEDAVEHLRGLAEGSLAGVTAFHFAEHVPLPVLTQVLDAAYIALAPGGTLMLETPNPTNLVVGASAFYLDPTHLRPLHPDFLGFLVESRGFVSTEVHFIHPVIDEATLHRGDSAEGHGSRVDRVIAASEWALFGPQDYILIAHKPEASV